MTNDIPEADRAPGAPHPRHAPRVLGQETAAVTFLDAFNGDTLHHAWLITGPRGVGKATLAWAIARFVLATPQDAGLFGAPEPAASLDIAPDHPVAARVTALSEPRLCLVRRPWDPKTERLRTEITVDEVRKLKTFFSLSVPDGGRRMVVVDAADEMNTSAANAILKVLEEPPPDTVMLLISHQPSRLLPTIRSRCRSLRCAALSPETMAQVLAQSKTEMTGDEAALTALASGSAGAAIRLLAQDGLATYARILGLFDGGYDRQGALKLADGLAGRANADRLDLMIELIGLMVARLARFGLVALGPEAAPGEAQLFARLSPHAAAARAWAELHTMLSARARHGQAVNLDPAALILDMTFQIHTCAARLAA